jgi:uncharacterized protein YcnI
MHRFIKVAVMIAAAFAIPSVASAHAVVFPKKSAPGAYEKYVLRVPNEKDVATTRVEIRFPTGLRVVSFADVAGWQLEELRDSSNAVVGAVWTGNLPPERFIEFPFVAVNPKDATTLVWPAYQTYATGERVEWTGPTDAEKPASSTAITSTVDSAANRLYLALSGLALLLSLTCLGLVLRKAP